MSNILVNDILDELFDENQRLLNELLFAEECLKKFNEMKSFTQLVFTRLNSYLEPNETKTFQDLIQDIDTKFAEKTVSYINYRMKYILQNIGGLPQMPTKDENQEPISHEEKIALNTLVKKLRSKLRPKIKTENISCEEGLESGEDCEPDMDHISESEPEDVAIDGVFKCLVIDCGQTFEQRPDLVEHRNIFHPKIKKFVCDFLDCGHRAISPSALRLHKMSVHSESAATPFKCQEFGCSKAFKTKRYLSKHMMRVHTDPVVRPKRTLVRLKMERSFECDEPGCCYKATRQEYLRGHKQNVHCTGRPFKCTFEGCGKTFKSRRYRYKHEWTHNEERSFVCDFEGCGKAFKMSGYLREHERRTHGKQMPFTDDDQKIKPELLDKYRKIRRKTKICPEPGCKFATATNKDLQRHRASVHSEERPFECELCHKRFKIQSILSSHRRVHEDNNKIYSCDWPGCDYTARQMGNIENHKSYIHSDVRNFKCDWPECDKAYKSKADLKTHQKRHRDDRLYPCSWPGCNYRSYDSTTLNNHMRSHTNERPFSCDWPGCQWKFTTKTGLLKHQRTHNRIRLKTCTERTSSSHYSNTNLNS